MKIRLGLVACCYSRKTQKAEMGAIPYVLEVSVGYIARPSLNQTKTTTKEAMTGS